MSGNVIVDIIEDEQGVFWIATRDGGLTRYDPSQTSDKQFTQLKNDPLLPGSLFSNRMTALSDLNKDYILISCENMTTAFVNKHNYEITYASNADNSHTLIDPRSGIQKPDKYSWVQCFRQDGENIYLSQLGYGQIKIFNKQSKEMLLWETGTSIGTIRNFEVDGDSIWIASWSTGIYVQRNPVNSKPGALVTLKQISGIEEEITCVQSLNDQILLAGSKTSGLYIVDKYKLTSEKISHDGGNKFSLASNRVNCIVKDNRGIVWVGTTAGLSKYNPVQWQFEAFELNENSDRDIIHFSTFSYNDSTIGLCTSNGIYKSKIGSDDFELQEFYYDGLKINPTGVISLTNEHYYLNSESGTFHFIPSTNEIKMLLPDSNFILGVEKQTNTKFISKGSYQVYNTVFDTINGNAYHLFATIGWGMGIYDETNKTYYDFCRSADSISLSNNFVRVIFKDKAKNIWVGTSEGLNKWHKSVPFKNAFTKYVHTDQAGATISNNTITGIYEDLQNHLWISTGNGLNEFDGERFITYTNPISNNKQMHGVYADQHHNLWIAVKEGFEVFNLDTKSFRHIPLLNPAWALKNPATIYQKSKDDWFYGAGNYLIRFDPDSYYFENDFPSIYLNSFSIFDRQLFQTPALENLQFKYSDNFVTIEFSSLQLSQPATVQYKYQLIGLNNDWVETGNNRQISFTSLPPGHYSLQVKVTNPQGDWSEATQLIQFVILKPYWQQWWFIGLCGLIAISITVWIIKYREQQFLKLQTMRNKIANDLHDDVGSALSTINLYSEVAKMKSDKENIELKGMLDKISDISIEMQENMNHIVWSLQPRNDNSEQMMLRLKNYALENLHAKNILTEFLVDEKLSGIKLDPDKRKELFLIYKEIINNIIKYAHCTKVNIQFYKSNEDLNMKISDNGGGFDTRQNTSGNGLHTMRERAKQLKGTIDIISDEDRGTTVHLKFAAK